MNIFTPVGIAIIMVIMPKNAFTSAPAPMVKKWWSQTINERIVMASVARLAVGSQSEFYHALWASGAAGVAVTLQVWRNKSVREIVVRSINRMDYLRPWPASAH